MVARSKPRFSPVVAERVAALEMAWDGLPDKIAAAIAEAVKSLTPRDDHDSLANRVHDLEKQLNALTNKNSYAAGVTKVEERVSGQLHEWARAIAPLMWPLMFGAYVWSQTAQH